MAQPLTDSNPLPFANPHKQAHYNQQGPHVDLCARRQEPYDALRSQTRCDDLRLLTEARFKLLSRYARLKQAARALRNEEDFIQLRTDLSEIEPQNSLDRILGKIVKPETFAQAYRFSCTITDDTDLMARCLRVCLQKLTKPQINDLNGWNCLAAVYNYSKRDDEIRNFALGLDAQGVRKEDLMGVNEDLATVHKDLIESVKAYLT